MVEKIAIMTAGGDCPGLNNVIYTVTKIALAKNVKVIGVLDGYKGFVEGNYIELTEEKIKKIYEEGGTLLGSSNKECPFKYLVNKETKEYADKTDDAIKKLNKLGINHMIIVGGDGTLSAAKVISERGMNVIGIPKTIDNDMFASTPTIGFQTAVENVVDSVSKLRTTAYSHNRAIIVEIMGRTSGYLTLYSGIASAADVILLPEIEYDLDLVCDYVANLRKNGKRDIILAVSEAAKEKGKDITVSQIVEDSFEKVRLGGVSKILAKQIEEKTGIETRATILGHIQRGGVPCANDRIIATRMARRAINLLLEGKTGIIVGNSGEEVKEFEFPEKIKPRELDFENNELVKAARDMGICLGV